MQKLETNTLSLFRAKLRKIGIPDQQMPHYEKWVRYFLDFESKYGKGVPRADLILPFMEKLANKGQSSGLREQAHRAVIVFLRIATGGVHAGAIEEGLQVVAEPTGREEQKRGSSGSSLSVERVEGLRRGWEGLEAALVGELKRRNYSPKTLTW